MTSLRFLYQLLKGAAKLILLIGACCLDVLLSLGRGEKDLTLPKTSWVWDL